MTDYDVEATGVTHMLFVRRDGVLRSHNPALSDDPSDFNISPDHSDTMSGYTSCLSSSYKNDSMHCSDLITLLHASELLLLKLGRPRA